MLYDGWVLPTAKGRRRAGGAQAMKTARKPDPEREFTLYDWMWESCELWLLALYCGVL